jgi:hypothetical protein
MKRPDLNEDDFTGMYRTICLARHLSTMEPSEDPKVTREDFAVASQYVLDACFRRLHRIPQGKEPYGYKKTIDLVVAREHENPTYKT